ncbi:MAG: hypothetical protein QXS45_07100 [Sulfolobales archaeon]
MSWQRDTLPIVFGLIAGLTVYIGAVALYRARRILSARGVGFLQAVAGGVLGYLALEAGHEVSKYVENLARPATVMEFLIASMVTTIAFLATYLILAGIENNMKKGKSSSLGIYSGYIIALALGIHNVGEGFAIVGPLIGDLKLRISHTTLLSLSMIAGLPTVLGSAVFYTGIGSELFLATLNTVATASIVYAMLHVNLSALGRLGGVSSPLFWTALTSGVIIAYSTESVVLFALAE